MNSTEPRPVAVVTGSAVGIGRELCLAFGARGMCVLGIDIDGAGNAETADLVGPSMATATCDVGDAVAVKTAIDDLVARTGRIDKLSGGLCRSDDYDAVKQRMASFMAAGFHDIANRRSGK